MGTSEHTEMSSAITARLARIEHELAAARRDAMRWRTGTIILGAVALAGGLVAATQVARVEDVIRVRRLEVVGEGDKVVMLAQAGDTGGQLDVWRFGILSVSLSAVSLQHRLVVALKSVMLTAPRWQHSRAAKKAARSF